jgi:hypothetical protein
MPRNGSLGYIAPSISASAPRLHAPKTLTDVERQIFAELVSSAKAGHFAPGDQPLLCEYARLTALLASEWAKQHAAPDPERMTAIIAAQKSLYSAARLLRLAPSARAPHPPGASKYQNQNHARTSASASVYGEMEILDG